MYALVICGWVFAKNEKDIGRSQKRCGVMKMGSGESRGSLGGEGGIKNRRAF